MILPRFFFSPFLPPPHSSQLFIYFSALFFLLSVGLKITICYRVRIHAFAAIFIDRVPLPHAHRFTHRLYCFGFSALTTLKRQNTKIFAFFLYWYHGKNCGKMPPASKSRICLHIVRTTRISAFQWAKYTKIEMFLLLLLKRWMIFECDGKLLWSRDNKIALPCQFIYCSIVFCYNFQCMCSNIASYLPGCRISLEFLYT